jgi:hypothetical protein
LTGKYNSGEVPKDSRYATNPEFFKDTVEKLKSPETQAKIEKIRKLTDIAEKELDCTMTHLALAWAIKVSNVPCSLPRETRERNVLMSSSCVFVPGRTKTSRPVSSELPSPSRCRTTARPSRSCPSSLPRSWRRSKRSWRTSLLSP